MMIVHQVLVVLLLLLIRSSLRMPVSATKVTVHIADADDRVIDTEYFDEALYRTCVEDTQELFRAYIRDPTEEKAASIEERVLRGDLPVECIAAVEAVVNHMHDDDNTNALMLACHKHHNVLVQKLVLNSGIDLNAASTKRGKTALIFSAQANNVEAAKVLILAGADPYLRSIGLHLGRMHMNLNPFNKDGTGLVGGKTALEYAQREGFTEIAQYLERWSEFREKNLKLREDVLTKRVTLTSSQEEVAVRELMDDTMPFTLRFMTNCFLWNTARALEMIHSGIYVNYMMSEGYVSRRVTRMAQLYHSFIYTGVRQIPDDARVTMDVGLICDSVTPLMLAAAHGQATLVTALLAAGAEPNTIIRTPHYDRDDRSALMLAVLSTAESTVQILGRDPRVNRRLTDRNGRTALHFAFSLSSVQAIIEGEEAVHNYEPSSTPSIASGADGNLPRRDRGAAALINMRNNSGVTVLLQAIVWGQRGQGLKRYLRFIVYLLEHGADPNLGVDEHTPLMAAVSSRNAALVSALLKYDADPNAECPRGGSALGVLLEHSNELHETFPDPAERERRENIDIMIARLLLEYGAETDVKLAYIANRNIRNMVMTARLRESFSSLTQFIDPEYMPRLLQIGDDWEKFMAVLQYIREQAKARARGSSVVEGADEGEVRVKQMMRLIVNEADDEDDADEVEEENLHGVDAGHVAGSYDHRKVNRLVFDEQGNTALHLVASVVPSSPSTTSASASAATASTSHRRDLVSMVCVARLLQIGADVHRKNRAGVSPLQMVQGMVREEPANSSFKTLLIKMTAAAMVQQIRRKDATGMMRAYLDSVPFITLTRSSSGSGVGEEDGRSAICRTNIMQALNRELFDGDRGSRALHVAVTAGCVQCVKLLVIEFGVDVNVAESRAPSIGARRQRSGKTVLALMERARQGLEREGVEGEGVERLLRRAEMEEMLKVVTMGLRFTEELSEGELDVPDTYLCPITRTLISHPARLVSAGGPAGRVSDTHAYEYSDLKQWVSMHHTSPLTREATSVTQIQTVPGMRVEIIGVKRKMREQYFGEKGVAIEGHVTAGLSFEEWTRERERAEEEAAFEQYLDSLPETEVPPEFFDPISFMLIHDPVWDRRVSRSRDSHSTNSDTGAGTRDSGSGSGSERERDRDQKVIMDRNTFERSVLERSVKKYHRNPLTGEKMDLEDIEENTDMRNRINDWREGLRTQFLLSRGEKVGNDEEKEELRETVEKQGRDEVSTDHDHTGKTEASAPLLPALNIDRELGDSIDDDDDDDDDEHVENDSRDTSTGVEAGLPQLSALRTATQRLNTQNVQP